MPKSLEAYAADYKAPNRCWLCHLPERKEIEDAYKAGILPSVIVRWLREEKKYPEATDKRIYTHMKNHV